MATQDVVVDTKMVDLAPIDPNVIIPRHVKEASQRAEAVFKAAYEGGEPQPEPTPEAAPEPEVAPPTAAPSPAPSPSADFVAPATPQDLRESEWAARYNSMRGRYEATTRQMGEMRAQMDLMANELQRSQELLLSRTSAHEPQSEVHHDNLITPEERDTFGEDLINVARKAAIETMRPEFDAIRAENAHLQRQVIQTAQRELKTSLAGAVPNWRAINVSPEFLQWLRLPNAYTGEVRKQVLDAAYKAADAPKVIAIFQDYVKDVVATGGVLPGVKVEQQAQQPAPRVPALDPMSIAAPGAAKPAGGDTPNVPVDKPIYTRAWIANFYRDVNRGAYRGRETEQRRIENDLSRAQHEGRVRG